MRKLFIKNLAVIPYARFETLFYQALEEALVLEPEMDVHLPSSAAKKMLNDNLDCKNLLIKTDLSLTAREENIFIAKLAEKLHSEDIRTAFNQILTSTDDITIKDLLSSFAEQYSEALLEKGAKVILNTSFGFKANNISDAIKRRGEIPPTDSYSSKLLVLDEEYFHYKNSKTVYSSFTEYRKEFLMQYFRVLNSYEGKFQHERFNQLFKEFI
ncbi:MAG: hypothetical protein IKW39_03255 [Alphaproteobacteria bacterium]|nr:hypothetical protein [Alphaproteobacteria bacterium]